jgi:hypothetical protein
MVLVLCCLAGRYRYRYPAARHFPTSRAPIAARDLRYARLVDTPTRAALRASLKRKPKNSCELSSTSSRAARAPRRVATTPLLARERVAYRCDAAAMDRLRSLAQRAGQVRNVTWVEANQSPMLNTGRDSVNPSRCSNMAEFALFGSSFYCGDASAHGVLPFYDDRHLVHNVFGPEGRGSPPVHGVRKRARRQSIKPPSPQV